MLANSHNSRRATEQKARLLAQEKDVDHNKSINRTARPRVFPKSTLQNEAQCQFGAAGYTDVLCPRGIVDDL